MGAEIYKQMLQKYYEGTGYKTDDLIQHILDLNNFNGYDASHDESLYIFYFEEFAVIVGDGGLNFVDKYVLG